MAQDDRLHVDIALPSRDRVDLEHHVRAVTDPQSRFFRHFITQAEFGWMHGAPEEDYESVAAWAGRQGLTVSRHTNHLVVSVEGSVADIEKAFELHLEYAIRPTGTKFRRPDRDPTVAVQAAVDHVWGLDTFAESEGMYQAAGHSPKQTTSPPFNHRLEPKDLRNAYAHGIPLSGSGALTGKGQTICIAGETNPTCVSPGDIQAFADFYSVPFSASQLQYSQSIAKCPSPDGGYPPDVFLPPTTHPDGGVEGKKGWPLPDGENTVDIEMAISMAPGATIFYYGSNGSNPLNQLQAFAENGCKQISISSGSTSSFTPDLINELALQGQSIFVASGDGGAWNGTGNGFGMGGQAVTFVGTTDLMMGVSLDAGRIDAEAADTTSGGGYMFGVPIPWFQLPAALNASPLAKVSLTTRNGPDVSAAGQSIDTIITGWVRDAGPDGGIISDGDVLGHLDGGATLYQHHQGGLGSSYATPIWGGFMALVNESIANNTNDAGPWIGYANPVLYSIQNNLDAGGGFHDIVLGNTEAKSCDAAAGCPSCCAEPPDGGFHAEPGYDLASGLGTPSAGLLTSMASYLSNPWYPQNALITIGFGGYTLSPNPPIQSIAGGGDGGGAWGTGDGGLFRFTGGAAGIVDYGWSAPLDPKHDGGSTGFAIQAAVSPTGTPWFINTAGVAYAQLPGSGGHWTTMNQDTSGPHTNLQWIAVGPSSAWGVTKTGGGTGAGNFQITTSVGTSGTSAWNQVSSIYGTQVAISPSTGTPWIINAQGEVFYGTGSGTTYTWAQVSFPDAGGVSLDGGMFKNDGGIFARGIAVGPAYVPEAGVDARGAGTADGVWVVTTHPWTPGSSDYAILQAVNYYNGSDMTWALLPGGGLQISVSPKGQAFATNSSSYAQEAFGWPTQ